MERSDTTLSLPEYPFTFEEDATSLSDRIAESGLLLTDFVDDKLSSDYAKLNSKLAHAFSRLNKCQPNTAEEKSAKSRLLVTIVTLHSSIESKIKRHERSLANQTENIPDIGLLQVNR